MSSSYMTYIMKELLHMMIRELHRTQMRMDAHITEVAMAEDTVAMDMEAVE